MTHSAERLVAAMGSHAHVVVAGGDADAIVDAAVARLAVLEARWSRFSAASDIGRLNDASGAPCVVSDDTLTLLAAAHQAWAATGGRFDPTVGAAVRRLGYVTSWADPDAPPAMPPTERAPGMDAVHVDERGDLVWFDDDVTFDPGGIGKGLAADIVTLEALAAGATGVCANVGGDVRVAGTHPAGPWHIELEGPDATVIADVVLADGAVATSSTARRRWALGDGTAVHHLVDPATGHPHVGRWATVSVVAGCAWWAEALTKHILAGGTLDAGTPDGDRLAAAGVDLERTVAVGVTADRTVEVLGAHPEWFVALRD